MLGYRDAEKTEIATILATANTAIDNAADETAIVAVVTEAKAALDGLKTDAQYTAEEAAAVLAAAKESAKTELAAYKNAEDYRDAEKTQLATILATANTEIEGCENADAITAVVTEAKTAMDALKTAAEYEEEEVPPVDSGSDDSSSSQPEDTENKDSSSASSDKQPASPLGCVASVNGYGFFLIISMLCAGCLVLLKKREK